jgi:hypothetical protein
MAVCGAPDFAEAKIRGRPRIGVRVDASIPIDKV